MNSAPLEWKALTICNPYPELILLGEKPIENRDWQVSYRGDLFIHAGRSNIWMTPDALQRFPNLTYGALVGVCTLVACLDLYAATWPDPYSHLKNHEHANGPWCWILENIRRFNTPIPCRGSLGLWNVSPRHRASVREQLRQLDEVKP